MFKKLILLTFVCISFFSCSNKNEEMLYKMPNKVVFILVDTLRADHLPFYHYPYNTAPFLNKLTKESVVFKNAFSTSSYTAPATASLFTSLYARDHGVEIGLVSFMHGATDSLQLNKLSKDIPTIASVFKDAGYETFGFSDNINISKTMGFDNGFSYFYTSEYKGADHINSKVLEIKKKLKKTPKYFLYIHYMDPHKPYNLRKQYSRSEKGSKRIKAYDSEISYVDNAIKDLYEQLKLDKDTLLIFTSDHGESFGERKNPAGKREFGHGKTLNRELLHIPLFFYKKGLRGQRIKSQVSHLDVLPTLSSLLGREAKDFWEGIDFSNVLLGKDNIKPRFLFSDLAGKTNGQHVLPEVHSVIYKKYHYIKSNKSVRWPEDEKIFNWDNDLKEVNEGEKKDTQIFKDLRLKVKEHVETSPRFKSEGVSIKMDKKLKNHLSTLGYIN